MLFCSAASGSLYSRAWPASTSSSFTFTWFSRSQNNLAAQERLSLGSHTAHLPAWRLTLLGLLFFKSVKLFFQLQHLVQTFSSPPLAVLVIHVLPKRMRIGNVFVICCYLIKVGSFKHRLSTERMFHRLT